MVIQLKYNIIRIGVFILAIILAGGFWLFMDKFQNQEMEGEVLGIEKREAVSENKPKTENKQNSNYFQLENAYAAGLVPVRKSSYYDLKIWAGSSVALDVDSGNILHYDNGKKRTQIASLTKVMTAILSIENIDNLEEEVTITKEAIFLPGTTVGCPTSGVCLSNTMYTGEKVKALDLLKAMLINSANDAAFSLAVHIAGSESKFVEMMNNKAKALGLEDTHFCTASGLEIDGQEDQCYSSAYDIARIAAASLDHSLIWKIMRIPEDKFYSADGTYMHELKNTDILIQELPNCIGGKTGFTPLAGKSLLFAGTDATGKHRVIMVLLNDPQRWEDMRTLNSWIFDNYEWK